jgi:NAD(P)-dependent dehydrogenase (short-subunit alcohol dehydrogenase family)
MGNGKVALVTGSSRGIGRGVALAFAKAGYDVAVHHSRSQEAAEKTLADIQALGVKACLLAGDTGFADVPERLVRETVEKLGRLDVLVNNAGITRIEGPLQMTAETTDEIYRVDFRGMILCASAAAKYMVDNNIHGNIIFNTSIRSVSPHGNDVVYGGLKAGLNRVIQSFAVELGPHGIRVNGFAPGITNVWQPEPELEKDNPFYGYSSRFIPLRRNGYAEDMGNVALFLASDAASYVTGQVIFVDGGVSAIGKPEGFFDLEMLFDVADSLNPPEGAKLKPGAFRPPPGAMRRYGESKSV